MKEKINIYLGYYVCIIVVFIVTGCSTNVKQGYVSGELPTAITEPVVLSNFNFTDTLPTNKNTFNSSVKISSPSYARLRLGNKFILVFLVPDKKLNIELRNDAISDTLIFSGDLKADNDYLYEKTIRKNISSDVYSELMNYKPEAFKLSLDSLLKDWSSFLTNYELLSPAFIELEQKAINLKIVRLKLEYCLASPNSYLIKDLNTFSNLSNINLNDSLLITQPEFNEFVLAYANWLLNNEVEQNADKLPTELTLIKMQLISRHFENGPVKDLLLYHTLNDHITYHGLNDSELLFRTYEFQCASLSLKQKLIEPYQKYLTLNNRGVAPMVNLIGLKGNTLSIEGFKGTYLFIDVWATWCTPCLREAPFFEKLSKDFTDKNIKFISLSVDDTKEEWMQFCKKHDKQFHQYWVNEKQDFLNDYMIKTIPRFIIIDPEGRIINADAPRPSENQNDWLEEIPNKVDI